MMTQCSSDMPVADRFDWWSDLTGRGVVSTQLAIDPSEGSRACTTQLQLGRVKASVLEFSTLRLVRARRDIQLPDPERWDLGMVLEGSFWMEQNRNGRYLETGDLLIYDTSQPCRSAGAARFVMLHLPRRAVSVPEQALRNLVAQPIPSRTGAGALMARFLEELAEQAAILQPDVTSRLESAAIGLATAFFASLTGAKDQIVPQTRQQALLHQIKTFVLGNLNDHELSPTMVAATHHISVRYLHHLFHEEGQSIGGFIRQQRLERCHADLADPQLINRTVADVGARWGFQDAAAFSRAFKAAYGIPPGEHRRRQ